MLKTRARPIMQPKMRVVLLAAYSLQSSWGDTLCLSAFTVQRMDERVLLTRIQSQYIGKETKAWIMSPSCLLWSAGVSHEMLGISRGFLRTSYFADLVTSVVTKKCRLPNVACKRYRISVLITQRSVRLLKTGRKCSQGKDESDAGSGPAIAKDVCDWSECDTSAQSDLNVILMNDCFVRNNSIRPRSMWHNWPCSSYSYSF